MTNIKIIHETKDYLIINKPSGLIVEVNPFESPTVESLVYEYLSESKRNPYVGIVHRLDRVTSGVMVFAKKKSVLKQLNESFRLKKVQKSYLAIVDQKPKKEEGTLSHFLRKDQKNKRAEIFSSPNKGAVECILHYEILDHSNQAYLLKIIPESGKFHQIRAQLSFIGCPIIGDEKYGSESTFKPLSICLHAWKLCFPDFTQPEKKLCFDAKLPQEAIWQQFQ